MILGEIAQRCLFVETLEVRHSDRLDVHDVGVGSLLDALRAAFAAGQAPAAVTRLGKGG